jgi:hypothetical protein
VVVCVIEPVGQPQAGDGFGNRAGKSGVNPGIHRGRTCDGCPDAPRGRAVVAARTAPMAGTGQPGHVLSFRNQLLTGSAEKSPDSLDNT